VTVSTVAVVVVGASTLFFATTCALVGCGILSGEQWWPVWHACREALA
jgi:hypothetical protein